jgi:hypothetical protein
VEYTVRSIIFSVLRLLDDNVDWFARSWAHRIAAIGLCTAIAIVGGSLVALAMRPISMTAWSSTGKTLFAVGFVIAANTGVYIAILARNADPGGWWGYLARVSMSTICAVISGMWAELLVDLLLGESQPTVSLVTMSNGTASRLDTMLFVTSFICVLMALTVGVLVGKKER